MKLLAFRLLSVEAEPMLTWVVQLGREAGELRLAVVLVVIGLMLLLVGWLSVLRFGC